MHSHDDKYPPRPGFELGTPRLQAPVDTNEPSGPARGGRWGADYGNKYAKCVPYYCHLKRILEKRHDM